MLPARGCSINTRVLFSETLQSLVFGDQTLATLGVSYSRTVEPHFSEPPHLKSSIPQEESSHGGGGCTCRAKRFWPVELLSSGELPIRFTLLLRRSAFVLSIGLAHRNVNVGLVCAKEVVGRHVWGETVHLLM